MGRTLKLWLSTLRSTFTNIGALAVFIVLYALLVATFLRFVWIREATVWQVVLTYAFLVLIPAEFFILQSAIVNRVRDQKFRWGVILVDAVKFFLATIPVVLLGWLVIYLLTKLQLRYPAPIIVSPTAGPPRTAPTHVPTLLIATLQFLLIAIALPLTAFHLWLAVAGGEVRGLFAGGTKEFLKRIGTSLARGFAFESAFIQGLGFLIWLVIPWMISHLKPNLQGYKSAFALIAGQLFLVFAFNFVGWVVTLSALTRNASDTSPEPTPDRSPAVAVEAAA